MRGQTINMTLTMQLFPGFQQDNILVSAFKSNNIILRSVTMITFEAIKVLASIQEARWDHI